MASRDARVSAPRSMSSPTLRTLMRITARTQHRLASLLTLTSAAVLVSSVLPTSAIAQHPVAPTGRITGRILDAGTGERVTAAHVQVVGTHLGIQSDGDGRFTIIRVPAGTVTLQVRRIGFSPRTITGILVLANGTTEQNVSLSSADVQLIAVRVTATKEQGGVTDALNQQQNASSMVNAITAEQIARSPDHDAAQAAQRVSGVTVQDGKYLQVRGLGERYTTASLNGARIPSPEPERKVVPLDLFPAGLLQDITTNKTFTPDQPGDFAGAHVNLRTREFPAHRQITYSLSMGGNDRVLGRMLPFAAGSGGELWGMASRARRIPDAIANANFQSNIPQTQYNQMARQQRNVWNATPRSGGLNGSFGASMGGNTILGRRIGHVLSANYGYAEEVRAREHFAVGHQGPDNTVAPLTQGWGETGRSSIQWGGLMHLSTVLAHQHRLSLNATVTRSADNEARTDKGFDENLADSIARTTLRYVERGVATLHLQGDHQLGERNRTAWSTTWGHSARSEPDRSDIVTSRDGSGRYALLASLDGARRLYFDLREQNTTAQVDHTMDLGASTQRKQLRFGVYARATDRSTAAPIYAFISRAGEDIRAQDPSVVFGPSQTCETCAVVNVQPIGQAGSYTAADRTIAGYLMTEWDLSSQVRLVAGARMEQAHIHVASSTQGGFTADATLRNTDLLPSLLVNTRLAEHQNLRFGLTRTLARPEYRELAPVTFRDVLGGVSVTGNNALVRSLIDNIDLRWEVFPNAGDVFSIGVFAKHFDRPIERLESATSGASQARFQNARGAMNVGVELEARSSLVRLGPWAAPFTAFGNVTLMHSSVHLDTLQGLTVTDRTRRLVGQAPYVVNAGLTYLSSSSRTNASLLYNVVGPRLHAAGVMPLPNIIETPRHAVDVSLRFPVWGGLSGRVDARNLLDARHRLMQGTLEREGYNAGRSFSMGLSWQQ